MYKTIVKRITHQTYDAMSRGDFEAPLKKFTPETRFMFAGDNALGCDLRGADAVREWFARAHRLFPDLKFEVCEVVVGGGPWRTNVSSHFKTSATLPNGKPYRNEGMQLLVLSWGKVVEDLVFEDTQKIDETLLEMGNGPDGIEEAHADPMRG